MDTLLLGTNTWDLVLDAGNNIAVASNPYSLAQDAASADRTFLQECLYNTTLGVDFKGLFFGKRPNLALMKAKLSGQAALVPDVAAAQTIITGVVGRRVTGQVQVTPQGSSTPIAAAF